MTEPRPGPGSQDRRLAHSRPAHRTLSPLELLHPDGVAERMLGIGGNVPDPYVSSHSADMRETVDLVVLAPTIRECGRSGWLEQGASRMAEALAADGVGYVVVPRRWRSRLTALIRRHELVVESSMIHVPNWTATRYIVPLRKSQVRWAVLSLLPLCSPWSSVLPVALRWMEFNSTVIAYVATSTALVVRRPRGAPLFGWIQPILNPNEQWSVPVMSTRWRGYSRTATLHCFATNQSMPAATVKVALAAEAQSSLLKEEANLTCLGPKARDAGADVPHGESFATVHGIAALRQTTIQGRPAVTLLSARPHHFRDLATRIVTWLERWNRLTVIAVPLAQEDVAQLVLDPAEFIAPALTDGGDYVRWLRTLSQQLIGSPFPYVAAHNDLTGWNILIRNDETIGIVDWESAQERGLPLADFCYALANLAAAAAPSGDRFDAFLACFSQDGAHRRLSEELAVRLRLTVPLSSVAATLCVHACWLHHAVNEHQKWLEQPSRPRPFLSIVRWLAAQRHCV